jgi:hypothetical protein
MSEPRLCQVQCLDSRGLHRMAYRQWGDAANPKVLVCVQGLRSQGRDFDVLATTQRGPRAQLHEFAGVGQAPTLVKPGQIEVPRSFLPAS